MGLIEDMKIAVKEHGEVHCTFEEHDRELELRRGTTTFDDEGETIHVTDGTIDHVFPYDAMVHFYRPMEMWN